MRNVRCHACDTRTHGRTVESSAVFSLSWIRNKCNFPVQERNNATSPLWLASPLPRRRHHRSTSRGARQRAGCHLTTSTRSSPQLILTEVLVSEPVVIWLQLQVQVLTASITYSSSSNQQSRLCSSRQTSKTQDDQHLLLQHLMMTDPVTNL